MNQFLLSLDEVERVKRINGIDTTAELAKRTDIARATWTRVLKKRQPTDTVLQALARLGAKPGRVLVADELGAGMPAA